MTQEERNNIKSLLKIAWEIGGDEYKKQVWQTLPEQTRMEFNWGTYESPLNRVS